jgi:predicted RNase H-like nuclease (RuvC/YqgF family)
MWLFASCSAEYHRLLLATHRVRLRHPSYVFVAGFTFARVYVCVSEAEKQELLNETQGLMAQITESMKEVTTLQGRYDEVKHARDTLQESVDVLKSHNNQLIDDLKTADRTQEELREFSDRQAAQHRESVERLEMLLRESKKSASQTVVEMSQNLKVRPVSGRILIAVYCAAFCSIISYIPDCCIDTLISMGSYLTFP